MPENIEHKNPTAKKVRKLTFKETARFLEFVAKKATEESEEIAKLNSRKAANELSEEVIVNPSMYNTKTGKYEYFPIGATATILPITKKGKTIKEILKRDKK